MEVSGEIHILSAPCTNCIRVSVGSRAGKDVVEKRKVIFPCRESTHDYCVILRKP
jgi:hypothetical protein